MVTFDALQGWIEREERGIKYYSGIAAYRTSFDCPKDMAAASGVFLDLDTVHDMARVRLN